MARTELAAERAEVAAHRELARASIADALVVLSQVKRGRRRRPADAHDAARVHRLVHRVGRRQEHARVEHHARARQRGDRGAHTRPLVADGERGEAARRDVDVAEHRSGLCRVELAQRKRRGGVKVAALLEPRPVIHSLRWRRPACRSARLVHREQRRERRRPAMRTVRACKGKRATTSRQHVRSRLRPHGASGSDVLRDGGLLKQEGRQLQQHRRQRVGG
mmetsp:Transcript_12282/g.43087  ORF Transcript_12282/g.43087 Transcript_12282/m.43087 type:complete len:221 (+) Transcript_12282:481-1143(+)